MFTHERELVQVLIHAFRLSSRNEILFFVLSAIVILLKF